MQTVPIAAIANQKFSIRLDSVRFVISIQAVSGVMAITIERNGVVIVSGSRCLPNQLVIPYPSDEGAAGNFMFLTHNDELPDYRLFNSTQSLEYITAAELAAFRV